ncbi:MAG TPA: ABC transporter permease [Candidatus Competibacteraceae bacterium]|nr:ABC transporter permease [Candidatus Competibacteraceae bacterium]
MLGQNRLQRIACHLWAGFKEPLRLLVTQRSLLAVLIRRDMQVRTSGTVLGGIWMLAQPALQVLALWFLLDFVLRVRFPGQVAFVDYFLLGMLPWLMVSEIISRSLSVLSEFGELYQRSVFPVRVLPLLPILFSGLVYGVVYTLIAGLLTGPAGALGAALLVLALLLWLMPLAYLMAVLGLFVRDLRQIAPFALTMILYLTPIMYMPDMLPEGLRAFLVLNPFADWMALIHAVLQDMAWSSGNLWRPLLLWLLLLASAWKLFLRSEPHIREEL